MHVRGRPLPLWLLVFLLGQLSVRAFVGGGALLVAPSGRLVGLSTDSLTNTPVSDFFVPGLVLLLAFGLLPGVVCYGLYANRWWAVPAAIFVAVTLLLWVTIQSAVGFVRPTVYVNLGTALGIVGVAVFPSVRRDRRGTTV